MSVCPLSRIRRTFPHSPRGHHLDLVFFLTNLIHGFIVDCIIDCTNKHWWKKSYSTFHLSKKNAAANINAFVKHMYVMQNIFCFEISVYIFFQLYLWDLYSGMDLVIEQPCPQAGQRQIFRTILSHCNLKLTQFFLYKINPGVQFVLYKKIKIVRFTFLLTLSYSLLNSTKGIWIWYEDEFLGFLAPPPPFPSMSSRLLPETKVDKYR